jgi:hypothetical protein
MASDSIWIIVLIRDRKTGHEKSIEGEGRSSKKVLCDGRLIKKDCHSFREEHHLGGHTDESTQPDASEMFAKSRKM